MNSNVVKKKMINININNGGEVRLPPGFRFHPTDEELVVQYLKRKVFSCPLPASIIPDLLHLSNFDPWDLPPAAASTLGDVGEQVRYFFSTKVAKYPNGNRSNRATNSGYWKATGLDKPILTSSSSSKEGGALVDVVVGMKKTLVFYSGKPPHGSRTDWIMHEYRLLHHPTAVDNWVLCRLFLKRRPAAAQNRYRENKEVRTRNSSKVVVFYDFLAQNTSNNNNNKNGGATNSCSSASSGITEEEEGVSASANEESSSSRRSSSSNSTFPNEIIRKRKP